MSKANEPAFPIKINNHDLYFGLTKRELIAAMAMQKMVDPTNRKEWANQVAKIAVDYADALLAELEKEK